MSRVFALLLTCTYFDNFLIVMLSRHRRAFGAQSISGDSSVANTAPSVASFSDLCELQKCHPERSEGSQKL